MEFRGPLRKIPHPGGHQPGQMSQIETRKPNRYNTRAGHMSLFQPPQHPIEARNQGPTHTPGQKPTRPTPQRPHNETTTHRPPHTHHHDHHSPPPPTSAQASRQTRTGTHPVTRTGTRSTRTPTAGRGKRRRPGGIRAKNPHLGTATRVASWRCHFGGCRAVRGGDAESGCFRSGN